MVRNASVGRLSVGFLKEGQPVELLANQSVNAKLVVVVPVLSVLENKALVFYCRMMHGKIKKKHAVMDLFLSSVSFWNVVPP